MKKTLLTLGAAAMLAATTVTAEESPTISDGLKEIGQAIANSTNWNIVAGGGHSVKGNNWLVFGDVVYNLNENVGLVAGVDGLFSGNEHSANIVKGGITLSLPMRPLAFVGSTFLTNIVATPYVGDMLATPTGGDDSDIGNLTVAGANFNLFSFKNFELNAGAGYENRQGQGRWDGNYIFAHLGISRNF